MQASIENIYKIFGHSTGVEIDTRKISAGKLFFCLKGENFNANEFAEEALAKGAINVIVDDAKFATDRRIILVENVLKCMQNLANFHRQKFNIPIIGITGTNGKTTTKELITKVLSAKFKTHSTSGNFNNHIGVPLTLLSMPLDTEIAVVEMGANHPHEINDLCKIAEPNFGIITNIGKAHLEGFGDLQGVIDTKRELYNFIAKFGNMIFVDEDNPLLMDIGKNLNKVTYGKTKNANYQAQLLSSEPFIEMFFAGKKIQTHLLGNYNFTNVLAALTIGSHFGLEIDELQKAISSYEPANKRSQLMETTKNKIYLDAYNANPTSMRNAIQSFVSINISPKIAIIGDMLELGKESFAEHLEIVKLLKRLNLEEIIFVGPVFFEAAQKTKFPRFLNSSDAGNYLSNINLSGKFILLKGSRGIGLEKIIQWL